MEFSVSRLFLLITGIVLTLGGAALFVIIYIGPVKSMKPINVKSTYLQMYSKKNYQIEMISTGACAVFIGLLSIISVFVDQKWLRYLTFICYIMMCIIALGMMAFYGYSYFFMLTASDSSMSKKLPKFEEAFECCGWKTPRLYPPCESSIGYQNNVTCYDNTKYVRNSSLQNFIFGGAYLLITIVLIIFIIIVTYCGPATPSEQGYQQTIGEEENVDDIVTA